LFSYSRAKAAKFQGSSQLSQSRSHAIIPATVAAISIRKVGQAAQGNTHSCHLILIGSHVPVRHLKSRKVKHMTVCHHLNTSVPSFTKPQHTAAIGRTAKTEKGMAEWLRRQGGGHPKALDVYV